MSTEYILQSAVPFPVGLKIDAPPYAFQGYKSTQPFTIYFYSDNNNTHKATLYAQGSRSIPWQIPQNKWSHLNPQWRFTDLSGNAISEVTFSDAVTTTFNSTTGYLASAQFYYIDDMPTQRCNSILLWATVDYTNYAVYADNSTSSKTVTGFANSKVIGVVPYRINSLIPQELEIDRNGIDDMFEYYWSNTIIPYVVSIKGSTGASADYGVLSGTKIMLNTPSTNAYGISGGTITRWISSIAASNLTWSPNTTSTYFSALDSDNFRVGGYVRGSVISLSADSNTIIGASGVVFYENIPNHSPYLWVSNPENNTINRISIPTITTSWLDDNTLYLENIAQSAINTSYLQVTAPQVMGLSGFHGIYGIALDSNKNVWCTDAESDKVYKFNSVGYLVSTLDFSDNTTYNFGATGGCTPAGVSIDSQNNIWLTFFDAASVLCIYGDTGAVKTLINPGSSIPLYNDPIYKPVLAEPDIDDNVWVTYSNSLCCALKKYTSAGVLISSINLPLCSNPMDIHIDSNNHVWVSLTTHSGPPYIGSVRKYNNTTGSLISSISAVNPAYIAIDPTETIWFTQSGNTLTRVTTAGNITHWSVGTPCLSVYNSPPNDLFLDNALEGLCSDVCNKVYVINSVDNILYTVSADQIVSAVKIEPDLNLTWYNDLSGNTVIYSESGAYNKSAQAFGDWSGYKWVKKYQNPNTTPYLSATLIGYSEPFNIYNYSGYEIRRFNESWDATNQIKSTIKQNHILNNPTLWDKYMNALWGSKDSQQGESFGREAYERIANFVNNHSDINTCNIDQLYSLANQTDVPIDSYGLSMPSELRRIMDIASVNQQTLWGSRCKCNRNITNTYTTYTSGGATIPTKFLCKECGHLHPGNKGTLFNPATYIVSAYQPFIVEERANNKSRYQLITPGLSCTKTYNAPAIGDLCTSSSTSATCITSYPLSAAYNILLPKVYEFSDTPNSNDFTTASNHFCFYRYVDVSCEQQIAGVINWDDSNTTLSEQASSVNEWYGEGQNIERMINYILHKGLGLVLED